MQTSESAFAAALLDSDLALPSGLVSHTAQIPQKRFGVYRNNVMVGLIGALEARFPATKRIVGEDFFKAMARAFATAHPPRSPMMMVYGDDFPDFIAAFEPAAEIVYLADVARIETARMRAYHAADAEPLSQVALASVAVEALGDLRFALHPSLEIIASPFPAVTIWAMNVDEIALAPLDDWSGEDALIVRPWRNIEVRRLPPGAGTFLQSLKAGEPLGEAAERAQSASPDFDLAINLALLFSAGLAIAFTSPT
ncbi:MAG: DNA-binding domain-containing protein [Methylocella sp.]